MYIHTVINGDGGIDDVFQLFFPRFVYHHIVTVADEAATLPHTTNSIWPSILALISRGAS